MYVKELIPWAWGRNVVLQNRKRASSFPPFDRQVTNLFDALAHDMDTTLFGNRDKGLDPFYPRLDLVENDKTFEVSVELPGINEKDIHLSFEEGVLTLQGEKKNETKDEKKNAYRLERSYGTFQRTIALPSEVDEEKIDATFKEGVLKITLPKTKEAQKEARQILVKAA